MVHKLIAVSALAGALVALQPVAANASVIDTVCGTIRVVGCP